MECGCYKEELLLLQYVIEVHKVNKKILFVLVNKGQIALLYLTKSQICCTFSHTQQIFVDDFLSKKYCVSIFTVEAENIVSEIINYLQS